MSELNELKPCPFCGAKAEIDTELFGQTQMRYTPFCTNPKCIAFYLGYKDEGLYTTKKKAAEAWNRRADNGT